MSYYATQTGINQVAIYDAKTGFQKSSRSFGESILSITTSGDTLTVTWKEKNGDLKGYIFKMPSFAGVRAIPMANSAIKPKPQTKEIKEESPRREKPIKNQNPFANQNPSETRAPPAELDEEKDLRSFLSVSGILSIFTIGSRIGATLSKFGNNPSGKKGLTRRDYKLIGIIILYFMAKAFFSGDPTSKSISIPATETRSDQTKPSSQSNVHQNQFAINNPNITEQNDEEQIDQLKRILQTSPSHSEIITSFNKLEGLAGRGKTRAMNVVAETLYQGNNVIQRDQDKAFYWFNQSALQKDPAGINGLGLCYANGFGAVQSNSKAEQLYKEAAESDYTPAMLNLAMLYLNNDQTRLRDAKNYAEKVILQNNKYRENAEKILQQINNTLSENESNLPQKNEKKDEQTNVPELESATIESASALAEIRSDKTENSAVIQQVSNGSKVFILETGENWLEVFDEHKTPMGFIQRSKLNFPAKPYDNSDESN